MPDYSWIAMVCGSFALVWSFLRTGLIFRALIRQPGFSKNADQRTIPIS